ncbi:type II secretion system minor pseudopilin GspJ [Pseudomaricurvus sp.]|uniref:type II secretion system minor pseudopilin GspJ n=1 Tax=Pseudomaricurvus sp. TaxID=2004510 RepID=UPI003F6C91FD
MKQRAPHSPNTLTASEARQSMAGKDAYHSVRQRGFTLLEVLIALSIFAIMGLASYHLLSGEARTQEALEKQSYEHNYWQRGMMRLTQDLQQAVNRSIREDYGNREPALKGEADSLMLTRGGWSNPLHRVRSDLQRVDYRLQTIDEQTFLQRSFWFALDRAPASEPVQQTLLPDIDYLQFRYYHRDNKVWVNQWPPPEEPDIGLPQAIEVTLTSPTQGQVQRLITLTLDREPQR